MDVVIPVMTNEEFLSQALALLGGVKGLSTLAIIAVAVQVFMKFVGTPWANSLPGDAGKYKLISYLACTYVLGVATQMMAGMQIVPALFSSTSLASLVLLINQLYKQFYVKAESPAEAPKEESPKAEPPVEGVK